ncbi:MAG: hypothetical protein R6V85_13275 [Polyangia bacterium]
MRASHVFSFLIAAATLVARPAFGAEPGGKTEPALAADTELEVSTDLPIGPILLGSFSLVGVAVGAGLGWQADQEYDDWKRARSDPMYADDPEAGQRRVDNLADDVEKHALAANILMFGGAALTAISVVWMLLAGGDEEPRETGSNAEETALRWRPGVGPGSLELSVSF